jgi:hypothetical protein
MFNVAFVQPVAAYLAYDGRGKTLSWNGPVASGGAA